MTEPYVSITLRIPILERKNFLHFINKILFSFLKSALKV